ncbi:MAG TPA: sigma-70 family RNA polymerase sigma factor [Myxococcota bacterium]|nr:sigma-70 family RNA polymerase sigma factor [Myxococcota bacterium]
MGHEIAERGPLAATRAARPIDEDPDRELVERWQSGDRNAFELLVTRHQRRVFRLLLRMLGSHADAEDVAQETFLNLHRHGHRFRSESRFSTFVYRVAANAALNRRRSLARAQAREDALAREETATYEGAARDPSPEAAVGGAEVRARVQDALLELSSTLRLPLVLYDIEGLSYGEIASILEVAEGTVKSRIHRARQALREALGRFVREGGAGRLAT